MADRPEETARIISEALAKLIPVASEGNLPMLAYLIDMARIEACAQAGKGEAKAASNIVPFSRH